jgi:hypothetical protein
LRFLLLLLRRLPGGILLLWKNRFFLLILELAEAGSGSGVRDSRDKLFLCLRLHLAAVDKLRAIVAGIVG